MPTSKFSPNAVPDLNGKVYLVTGGNAGMQAQRGKSTVVGLAKRGAKVYIGSRNESKALAAADEIQKLIPTANILFLQLDLGSFESVIAAAQKIRQNETELHGLVNNAGIMGVPYSKTTDGYELQFQTNYLSHWLLTYHLLPLLASTATATGPGVVRIVNVTSDGHSMFPPKEGINFEDIGLESSSAMTRYGQSKLANILHAKELHRRYGPKLEDVDPESGEVWVAAVHPGHIDTDLNRQATTSSPAIVLRAFTSIGRCVGILDKVENGSLSSIFAIASDDFKRADSGSYVVPYAKIGQPSKLARDEDLASKLWAWTADQFREKGLL
ncbi:putative oxidoreductase C736,13 [Talaromyces islandicus]|uniref:Putative oxidoreductase C736,13 n=1 Tax=Talaromyces islandicus TaxID=28573 RepID=A0A0U1LSA7_TALIS|nr:putative oxidoreductase C736,13 [Talaromyces islandicus]